MTAKKPAKIVLAYSGGLDTSVILRWLIEEYGAEVIAFCADVGQGEELTGLDEKARATGASRCVIADLRQEFAADFCFPMLRAAAVYESEYLLGTAIARPVITKALVELARNEGADAIAHGATGKGNDQVRFELAAAALHPELAVIAPWRQWSLRSRRDCIDYAKKRGIALGSLEAKPYSMDANLLHISYEGGQLEDPWQAPDPAMFRWTVAPEDAPSRPQEITIRYHAGDPVALNGQPWSPAALLTRLNELGAKHGIGRADIVENRFVGMKSRGIYETPGGTILHHARRAMESLTMDRELLRLRDSLVPEYARLVYQGFWFSPEREALQQLMDSAQRSVTGQVRLWLYRGQVQVCGRRSDRSLYDPALATFEEDSIYDQRDAGGFVRLQSLRLRQWAAAQARSRSQPPDTSKRS